MMHIVNLEEIQDNLLHIPGLIQRFENRDVKFAFQVKEWLVNVEKVLTSNRLAVAAEIAVLRGVLILAERGVMPSGMVFSGKMTSRKMRDAVAADVLRKADETISAYIKAPAAQIAEGERLTRQIVALAMRKGLIQNENRSDHAQKLNDIWKKLSSDPELGPVATHIGGLVGAYDALILLDRMLAAL